jgi:HprK-related kinase A
MIVADLSRPALAARLAGSGLRLRTGPVVNCIRSPVAAVVDGIALHYAQHPVADEDGFADFHVSVDLPRGLRRWIQPQVLFRFDGGAPFNPLPGGQGFPMLEWGLNWCVSSQCHQYLILHAAVLERAGHAIILPAPSGSGKSTLCAGLAFGGWRLLSDELTLIEPRGLDIVPIPRPISLKNASIDVIGHWAPQAVFSPVVHDTVKGSVAHVRPAADAVQRAGQAARPGWVVIPRYAPDVPCLLEPLPKAQAMMQLVDNAFNHNVHGRAGFEALAGLIDASDCFALHYADLTQAVELLSRLPTPAGHRHAASSR